MPVSPRPRFIRLTPPLEISENMQVVDIGGPHIFNQNSVPHQSKFTFGGNGDQERRAGDRFAVWRDDSGGEQKRRAEHPRPGFRPRWQ
jgi:hypothetical protein